MLESFCEDSSSLLLWSQESQLADSVKEEFVDKSHEHQWLFLNIYYCTDIFLKPFVHLVELKLEKMDMAERSNLTLAEEVKSHNKSFMLILCQW